MQTLDAGPEVEMHIPSTALYGLQVCAGRHSYFIRVQQPKRRDGQGMVVVHMEDCTVPAARRCK